MTSSRKGILRGVKVDGVTFCSPSGHYESEYRAKAQESESLKALETFWFTKGEQEGREHGYERGFKDGESAGYRKGQEEGSRAGHAAGDAEGFERGLKQGREEGKARFLEAVQQIESLHQGLLSEREQIFVRLKPELIRLTLAATGKIIRQSLEDSEELKGLISRLLDQARPAFRDSPVHLVLSPESLEELESHKKELQDYWDVSTLTFAADPQLPSGDYRIESDLGMIHFNLDRQLNEIEQKVLGSVELEERVEEERDIDLPLADADAPLPPTRDEGEDDATDSQT